MPRPRVLVVDDEDAIREIAQISLEAVGNYEVRTAASGVEGMKLVATENPDAILLDVMMPELDGPGMVVRLQASTETQHIPVILLTAKVQASDRDRFAQLPGVTGVIAKPFDPMLLPGQVADLLGWNA